MPNVYLTSVEPSSQTVVAFAKEKPTRDDAEMSVAVVMVPLRASAGVKA